MELPIKVFVLGSCVSRDPFEIAEKNNFEIIAYHARSSFSSLGAKPHVDQKILSEIKSNWQRKMVRADMEKSVLEEIKKNNFDILLIDLIDERFNISVRGDSVHTVSNEYKKALYQPNSYSFLKASSKEKLKLWKKGLEVLSDLLKESMLEKKVVINKVYWTLKGDGADKLLDRYTEEAIYETNAQLEVMYDEIANSIPDAKFINYNSGDLIVDKNHKWGLEPFHFSRNVFLQQLKTLNEICSSYTSGGSEKSKKCAVIHTFDAIKEIEWLGSKVRSEILTLIEFLYYHDPLDFYRQANMKNCISFNFNNKKLTCDSSFLISQSNYLCFFNEEQEIEIVLEQRHLNVSAIYFRKFSLVYKFDAATFPLKLVESFCLDLKAKSEVKNNSYIGVLVSYSRPYHYFYDMVPALKLNLEKMSIKEKYSVTPIRINGADFLNLDFLGFFNGVRGKDFASEASVNKYLIKNGFIIKLGYPNSLLSKIDGYFNSRLKYISKFDEMLLNIVQRDSLSIFHELNKSEFVFWVGICGEKRRWKEQEKGIALCVSELRRRFSSVVVLVDGFTSPISGENVSLNADKENDILQRIQLPFETDKSIKFISLINQTSVEKIKYSQFVDAFLTGFLTDSMYPARFSKAVGIGHGSYAAKEKYLEHIHPKTHFIKSDRRRDASIFKKTNENWARQSYSIRSGDVLKEFKMILDNEVTND
ncbi:MULTISPECIES: DUF6270 domain-containing protein [unclassified Halomonas]|uniref:DUF6270 domain-containing protein n=1 Tax=unclassified Halomonas TaxID=2609666 RepID=UPI002076B0E7|nr:MULTISPECIES: DUF6270 domain-containing protein [unclassified Halomonas]